MLLNLLLGSVHTNFERDGMTAWNLAGKIHAAIVADFQHFNNNKSFVLVPSFVTMILTVLPDA